MKKVLGWVVFTVLAVVIGGFVFVHFSPDYNMYLVRSESMKPAINMGDMVVIGPLDGPIRGEAKPGSIVTYLHGAELVTHRVLSVDGSTLLTKGDAVEDTDPWAVSLSDVRGVYLFKIPGMGYVSNFIRTKPGWLLVVVIPAAVLVAFLIRDIRKKLRESEKVA
ncbi:MAG: signal peptidase I [Chloroflexi bacterium]|nr:signal peptidase I [Chloroflexota bacterium]